MGKPWHDDDRWPHTLDIRRALRGHPRPRAGIHQRFPTPTQLQRLRAFSLPIPLHRHPRLVRGSTGLSPSQSPTAAPRQWRDPRTEAGMTAEGAILREIPD